MRQALRQHIATITIALSALSLSGTVQAAPASDQLLMLPQPDGSEFSARVRGNEWTNRIETDAGFIVQQDDQGWWRYNFGFGANFPVPPQAPSSAFSNAAPTAAPAAAITTPQPSIQSALQFGAFDGRVLFILTKFSDRAEQTSQGHWVGFLEDQLRDYFLSASHGVVNLRAARESHGGINNGVVGWLDLGYPHPNSAGNTGTTNRQLTRDALLAADSHVDFASYDSNGDQILSPNELAIIIVAAGHDAAYAASPAPKVWSHTASLTDAEAPLLDGVSVGTLGYAQIGELHDDHPATLGPLAHELGHLVFGLPELADEDNSSSGIGAFGLMGSGLWGRTINGNHIGETPVLPSAWSRLKLGWAQAPLAVGEETLQAPGATSATSGNTLLRGDSGRDGEYFLVENRQPLGYDRGLEAWLGADFGGLAIWHIDENQLNNDDDSHPLLKLEEADNVPMGTTLGAASDLWQLDSQDHFDALSTPDSLRYDNADSGVSWQRISAAGSPMSLYAGPTNNPPQANDDSLQTDEDTPLVSHDLRSNDSDPDGDPLDIALYDLLSGAGGKIEHLGSGRFRYTPPADFHGEDSFSYSISDGLSGRSPATVSITVQPINDAPRLTDDLISGNEDEVLQTPSLLANDSDIEGDSIQLDSFDASSAAGGSVEHLGNAVFRYTPPANFNGADQFAYRVSDSLGAISSGLAKLDIAAVNDPPQAVDDEVQGKEDSPLQIAPLANDTDIDGDSLSLFVVNFSAINAVLGQVELLGNGLLRYTPPTNFHGTDQINYVVTDGAGGTASAQIRIQIAEVNDAPLIVSDSHNGSEDESLLLTDPSSNDSDVDGDTLQLIGFDTTSAAGGSLQTEGELLRYIPPANFNGSDSFNYRVSDGRGGEASGTVQLQLAAVNDAPLASDDNQALDEDTTSLLTPLSNDSDVDGDALQLGLPALSSQAGGTLTPEANGQVRYTPPADFHGEDQFSYSVSDGQGASASATFRLTVRPVNDAPIANADNHQTDEDHSLLLPDPAANDEDVDGDSVSLLSFDNRSSAGGTLVAEAGGIRYQPAADFHGEDQFSYVASDGVGGETSAVARITVLPLNDDPKAANDLLETAEDTALSLNPLSNDSDVDGDVLLISSFDPASQSGGTVSSLPDGRLRYLPAADFHGVDRFNYRIGDQHGGSAEAQVEIDVAEVNDAPIGGEDSAQTEEDTAVQIRELLANDRDVDGDPLQIAGFDSRTVAGGIISALGDDLALGFRYDPPANFHGTDSFNYTLSDGRGGLSSAAVQLQVSSVNDIPLANDDHFQLDEDVVFDSPSVFSNDIDVDEDTLQLGSFETTTAAGGSVEHIGGGRFRYTPPANFIGEDLFAYYVSDGQGGAPQQQSRARVILQIQEINDLPEPGDDALQTHEDTAVDSGSLLDNDRDPDGDPLSILDFTVSSSAGGSVEHLGGGRFRYTPPSDFHGTDSFSYRVADDRDGISSAQVTVEVLAINDAPQANDDQSSTAEDQSVNIDVLANDRDIDGDSLSISALDTAPEAGGNVTLLDNQQLRFTPAADFNGTVVFSYRINDGQGGSDEASVSVIVSAVNDPPVGVADSLESREDEALEISPLANDTDVDGDALSIESFDTQSAAGGHIERLDVGLLRYQPPAHFHGADSFSYTLTDPAGGSAQAIVSLSISAVNDPPLSANDSVWTWEDAALEINPLENDSDADGEALKIGAFDSSSVAGGVIEQLSATQLRYTPPAGFFGQDSFGYSASDAAAANAPATVSVEVRALQPAALPSISPAGRTHYAGFAVQVATSTEGAQLRYTTDGSAPQNGHGSVADSPLQLSIEQSLNLRVVAWGEGLRESAVASAEFVIDALLDSDGDHMPDLWELAHQLDPQDAGDALGDPDGDGLSNLDEYLRDTDPRSDSTPPLMVAPADISTDASGYYSAIELGDAFAIDLVDGEITPVMSQQGPFRPGRHQIIWRAVDAVGNASETTQLLSLNPRAEASITARVAEGGSGTLRLWLNGEAPSYPVRLHYTVSGDAAESDHDLRAGVLEIASGRSAEITFAASSDTLNGEPAESIDIQITQLEGAVLHGPAQLRSLLVEDNLAPRLTLSVQQQGQQVARAARESGQIVLRATVSDPNPRELLSFDWSLSDNALLAAAEIAGEQLLVDPSQLDAGLYRVRLQASDGELSASADLLMRLDEGQAPTDSDGDGSGDSTDPLAVTHLLQLDAEDRAPLRFIATEPELQLVLGPVARAAGRHGAAITQQDLASFGAADGGATEAGDADHTGLAYFDLVIRGLDQPGDAARLSLPLTALPESRLALRLFDGQRWRNFSASEGDLASAVQHASECPALQSREYALELDAEEHCVRLRLSDGGANDVDGLANGEIHLRLAITQSDTQSTSDPSSGGGGGALNLWWLLVLAGSACWQRALIRKAGARLS